MSDKEKRTIHYSFKATSEENKIILQKMKLACIKNQSAFNQKITLSGYMLKLDLPKLREAVRLIGGLCNNVNHIARRMNDGGSII